jgi:membrane-associated HD superfamily phosphohydrolase
MKELTIVVGILVFILAIAIVFSIFQLMDENRKLRADVRDKQESIDDKQSKIDELMNRPSMVGLAYKTDKETIKGIMNSISEMFEKSKNIVCKLNKDNLASSTSAFADSVVDANINCSTRQTDYDTQVNTYVDTILTGTTISATDKTVIKTAIKRPFELILAASCSNNQINKEQLVQLLTDMWDALCKA